MSPDERYHEMLGLAQAEIASLSVKQKLLYGYVAAMRQVPAYLSFCQRNPDFGNAELADEIIVAIRHLVLTGEKPSRLDDLINLLDEKYVPNMDDFGSESAALEGALALVFLYKYTKTKEPEHILEIIRGIIECILMSDDTSKVTYGLSLEQSTRKRQFELIKSYEDVRNDLLARCLALNDSGA